jgi:NAD dependent epimerase/dehydratase family enzyme
LVDWSIGRSIVFSSVIGELKQMINSMILSFGFVRWTGKQTKAWYILGGVNKDRNDILQSPKMCGVFCFVRPSPGGSGSTSTRLLVDLTSG